MPLQQTQLAEPDPNTRQSSENPNPDAGDLLASWEEYVSKTGFDITKKGIKAGFGESDGIWFYHCAKAGTSFRQTLWKYACPRLPANTDDDTEKPSTIDLLTPGMTGDSWSRKFVYPKYCDMQIVNPADGAGEFEYVEKFAGMAAGMIRDPLIRALSGYYFGPYHIGIGSNVGEDPGGGGKPSPKMLEEITHSPTPFPTYANSTRIKGCQVRMLIGRKCGENYTPTTADVAEAIRVMKNEFLFVGVTDEWAKSIFLFHGLFGGVPTKSEFHNMRETHQERPELETKDEAVQQVQEAAWNDPYDGPLFKEASKLVNAQFLQVFGPGCKREPDMAFCRYFNIKFTHHHHHHHHH